MLIARMAFLIISFFPFSYSMPWNYDLAMSHALQGDYEQAEGELQQLLFDDEDNAILLYNAGVVASKLEKNQEAMSYFLSSAKKTKEQGLKEIALYNAATAAVAIDDLTRAITLYDEVLQINTDNEYARHNKAILEQRQQKKEAQENQEQNQANNNKQSSNSQQSSNQADESNNQHQQGQRSNNEENNENNSDKNDQSDQSKNKNKGQGNSSTEKKNNLHNQQQDEDSSKRQSKADDFRKEKNEQMNDAQKLIDEEKKEQEKKADKEEFKEASKKALNDDNAKTNNTNNFKGDNVTQNNSMNNKANLQNQDNGKEKTAQELIFEKVLKEQDSLDQEAHASMMRLELQRMGGKKGDKSGW